MLLGTTAIIFGVHYDCFSADADKLDGPQKGSLPFHRRWLIGITFHIAEAGIKCLSPDYYIDGKLSMRQSDMAESLVQEDPAHIVFGTRHQRYQYPESIWHVR